VAAVVAARVVTPAGVIAPGVVDIDDTTGLITHVAAATGAVPDLTLTAGFVDLQVNGIDDVDVAHASDADWARLDALLAEQGTTTWCPTLVTAPLTAYSSRLANVQRATARSGLRPTIAGAHLEGPFLGGAPGAHRRELIVAPDLAWIEDLPDVVTLMTVGPEAEGALEAIAALDRRGIVVSVGHSAANRAQTVAAIDAGARLVTHLFNGMPPLHHRDPGLVGTALTDDRLTTSLIADLVHVDPVAVALAFRAKGAGRVALITDAVAWRAGAVGGTPLRIVDGAPRLANGTLAGSTLTMDRAVANVVHACNVSLTDALTSASRTPAELLGLHDRGVLEVGRRADLVALDDDLRCRATWIAGQQVHG
jgi:N-acetylglucosamine-6-phosphate deacetylase